MNWREAALEHYRRSNESEIVDMKMNAFLAGAKWFGTYIIEKSNATTALGDVASLLSKLNDEANQ